MDVVGHLDTLTDKTQTETHVAPTTRGTQAENVLQRVVMIFGGEYDLACKEHLRADLERLANVQDVVLDFTDVTYIDSTVVVELIRINQIRSSKGYKRDNCSTKSKYQKTLYLAQSSGRFSLRSGAQPRS